MPGTYDDLWWIVLGLLVGWLAFWLIDRFFRRDGEPANVDTVKALENIDTLEAQLKEAKDERDSLRKEAESQRAEAQRLGGLLENLRESNAEQSQQITNLQAALDAARTPAPGAAREERAGGGAALGAAGALGGLAASAAAAAGLRGDDTGSRDAAGQDSDEAASADRLETDALGEALGAGRDSLESALDPDTAALTSEDPEDWFEGEDSLDTLEDLEDQFPGLDDEEPVPTLTDEEWPATQEQRSRSIMGRLDGDDLVDDEVDKPGGLLGRLRRSGGQRPD